MEELVSAIIITYKRDVNVLKRAIESIENQTYRNIEIIVVDDNSNNDKYRMNLKKYIKEKNNIVYLEHERNYGAQISRNDGIKIAKGKYIAFLDDDDSWMPKKIEKQIELFKSSNVGMVFCKGYTINEQTGKKEKYYNDKIFETSPNLQNLLEEDYIGTTSQAIISKECFEKVRFI